MQLAVSWGDGDVMVELDIPQHVWARILAGNSATLTGQGYDYESERFIDTWYFAGGINGELVVSYEPANGDTPGGIGITCTLRDALVE